MAEPPDASLPADLAPTTSVLPFWKVMVLGLSAMQVGPNLALSAGFQVPYSGASSWLAYAGAGTIAMLVAIVLGRFAVRHSVTASLLSFVQVYMPAWAVSIVAVTLLSAYILAPAISVLAFTIYLGSLASSFGFEPFGPLITSGAIAAALALLIGACAYRGVELSAAVGMALGVVCIPLSVWITLKAGHSSHFDIYAALGTHGLSAVSLSRGIFIAMGFFIGFDCIAALAGGTAHPQRDARRILAWTVAIAAISLILGALFQAPVLIAHAAALEAGDSPTKIFLEADGPSKWTVWSDLILVATGIAGLVAWLNGAAFIVAAAARDGFLPAAVGTLHPPTGLPRRAIVLLTAVSMVLPATILLVTKATPLMATLYISNFLIFAWLLAYSFLCVAMLRQPKAGAGAANARLAAGGGLILMMVVTGAQLAWPLDGTAQAINVASVTAIAILSVCGLIVRRRKPVARH